MQVEPSDASRIARERDYHNRRFTEDTRREQHKYYDALKACRETFAQSVTAACRDKDVLEYGCARGDRAMDYAPLCRSLTGIDISEVAIDAARREAIRNGFDHCDFFAMNAEELSFPDASFDLVFGAGIIHHLDLDRCFGEIVRVLRPGGVALFSEPLGHNVLLNLYRNVTPAARTEDEHPLLKRDLALAERYFATVECQFFGLTTVAAVALRGTQLFSPAARTLERVDRMIFQIPGMKYQAWYVFMKLRK